MMWVRYNNIWTKCLSAEEFDLSKVLKEGDVITYESSGYARAYVKNNSRLLMTGKVIAVYPCFALVKTRKGFRDTANWWDVVGVIKPDGKRTSEMVLYEELLRSIN